MKYACVYLIYDCDTGEYLYVGSTKNFKTRRQNHACHLMRFYTGNWEMKIIESYSNIHKDILRFFEEEYRTILQPKLNRIRAYMTDEQRKKYLKEYYSQTFECECGRFLTRAALVIHRNSKIHKNLMESQNKG